MSGYGPQGSPTVLIPTVPQPSAGAPGLKPPADSSWLDSNLVNEPQFITNSSGSMASNLLSGNGVVVAEGAGPSTPPSNDDSNTQIYLETIAPNTKAQQGIAAINNTAAVQMAGVPSGAVSFYKWF
jgi:hypothetical protein